MKKIFTAGQSIALIIILAALLLLNQNNMKAQDLTDVSGEYHLRGIPEMASGFKLNPDKTFEFFYIYGAADRDAHGTYETDGNKIILKGSKIAGNDFEILLKKISGSGITVSITDENKILMKNVVCIFVNGNDTLDAITNSEGIANIDMPGCKEIRLIHPYFPDEPTIIDLSGSDDNYFELSLKPSLQEVVFDNFILNIDDKDSKAFYCNHLYLFGQDDARFVKN
ncbi:MAG: hypothetical protein ABI528_01505 [bacterium]